MKTTREWAEEAWKDIAFWEESQECFERKAAILFQQAIDDATLPFREFANDFLDWDGEVEPHRTRMQLADMARRLLDLPCAKGAEGQGEMTWRNR